jgi:fructosamine-3-kinase
LIEHIAEKTGEKILNYQPVSGGDIADAFVLKTTSDSLFLKTLENRNAKNIFSAEAQGLLEIKKSDSVAVPEIICIGEFDHLNYLLLEYIDNRKATKKDFEKLGRGVAMMHQTSTGLNGFESDNFIGVLSQKNSKKKNWVDFYAENRLWPQLKIALKKKLLKKNEIPEETTLLNSLRNILPLSKPALLHGDLWSGNYLISKNGIPYLIDPAVYYGHREADLAMSRLFGGFDESFYQAYYEIWPKESGEQERIEIYQLYHMLVHLNLFGMGYKASVKRTLEKYF